MLVFSKRLSIVKLFEKWCKENDASDSPFNMLVFLQTNGLLNEEKCLEFLDKNPVDLSEVYGG